jgi:hypothetical protein
VAVIASASTAASRGGGTGNSPDRGGGLRTACKPRINRRCSGANCIWLASLPSADKRDRRASTPAAQGGVKLLRQTIHTFKRVRGVIQHGATIIAAADWAGFGGRRCRRRRRMRRRGRRGCPRGGSSGLGGSGPVGLVSAAGPLGCRRGWFGGCCSC